MSGRAQPCDLRQRKELCGFRGLYRDRRTGNKASTTICRICTGPTSSDKTGAMRVRTASESGQPASVVEVLAIYSLELAIGEFAC